MESEQAEGVMDALDSAELENEKVGLVRTQVETQDPSAKDVDDLMIRRFLRARDLDIKKASALLLKYLKWRQEFIPKGFVSESEVERELAQKKVFLQGYDRKGRSITVILANRHIPTRGKAGIEQFKRLMVFCLDKICASLPSGHEKFTAIVDLQGWGFSNFDFRGYIAALSVLQEGYPERLGKVLIIHVPLIFSAAWKLIYPFIDENTRKKIVFIENKNLKSTLLHAINEDQLPEIYGGKLPLVAIQDA